MDTKGTIAPLFSNGFLYVAPGGEGKFRYMNEAGQVEPTLLSKAIKDLLADFTLEDHIRAALVRRARRIATRVLTAGKGLGSLEYKGVMLQPSDFQTDRKEGIVTAYAAAFGNTDEGDDILYKRAFEDTLAERPLREVKVLYNHKTDQMVGSPRRVVEDDHGLLTESKYNLNSFWGNEAFALVDSGDITGYSFGYLPRETGPGGQGKGFAYDDLGRRHLYSVNLFEYGPLAIPMNTQAFVVGVKSGLDHGTAFSGLAEQAANAILDLHLEAEALATRRLEKGRGRGWLSEENEKAIGGFLDIARATVKEFEDLLAAKPGGGDQQAALLQSKSLKASLDLMRARLAYDGIKEP